MMKEPNLEYIQNYIRNIQEFSLDYLKQKIISRNHFKSQIKNHFSDYEINNLTDFNYSNNFLYSIVINKEQHVEYSISISLSIIGPFGMYYFTKTDNNDMIHFQRIPFRNIDNKLLENINNLFEDIEYYVITDKQLKQPVNNVELELRSENVQVGHCLFDDDDGDY